MSVCAYTTHKCPLILPLLVIYDGNCHSEMWKSHLVGLNIGFEKQNIWL